MWGEPWVDEEADDLPPGEDWPLQAAGETWLPRPAQYLTLIALPAVGAAILMTAAIILHYTPAFAQAGATRPAPPTQGTAPRAVSPGEGIAPFFTPEVRHWESATVRWGRAYGLDPNLIATVMQIESCGDPQALSSVGARGLFQVMPFHFSPGENPFEPETNARRGLTYLRQAMQRAGGDPALALAGYNGGLGVIGRAPALWPLETRIYVRWGAPIYRDAAAGKDHSPALEGWLAARGRSLCLQAHRRLGLP